MPTIEDIINESEEEFDKEFPCIESSCDNNGTFINVDREGQPYQDQCQYCYQERLPKKQRQSKSIRQAVETVMDEIFKSGIIWDREKYIILDGDVFFTPEDIESLKKKFLNK